MWNIPLDAVLFDSPFFTCITSSRCCVLHELFLRVISLDISQENLFILYISFHVVWHQQHHIHMIPPHSRSNNSNNGWGYKKMEPKFSNGIFKVLLSQSSRLYYTKMTMTYNQTPFFNMEWESLRQHYSMRLVVVSHIYAGAAPKMM